MICCNASVTYRVDRSLMPHTPSRMIRHKEVTSYTNHIVLVPELMSFILLPTMAIEFEGAYYIHYARLPQLLNGAVPLQVRDL